MLVEILKMFFRFFNNIVKLSSEIVILLYGLVIGMKKYYKETILSLLSLVLGVMFAYIQVNISRYLDSIDSELDRSDKKIESGLVEIMSNDIVGFPVNY
jgi:hypothetical protein